MALKLLQPGLRPIGQFALDDDITAGQVTGGEVGVLQQSASSDLAPVDVTTHGPIANDNGRHVEVTFMTSAADHTSSSSAADVPALAQKGMYLLDDGIKGYGTLFGEAIGSSAGQATSISGAVTIGPRTSAASGKVTCWHQQGLYGISSPADPSSCVGSTSDAFFASEDITDSTAYAVNTPLIAVAGKLKNAEAGSTALTIVGADNMATGLQMKCNSRLVAYFIGKMNDTSLVSTSTLAATGSAGTAECYAVHFLGANSSVYGAIQTDA